MCQRDKVNLLSFLFIVATLKMKMEPAVAARSAGCRARGVETAVVMTRYLLQNY